MKKLFSKISALFLGLAMAIGVGAAIGSNVSVSGVNAEDKVLTFDLSKNPGSWPTTNSSTLTNYTYTLSGTSYTFALKNVKCNSGYLMLTSTAVLGLPAIKDYKLTKIVAKNSGGCSQSTRVGVSSSSSSASYITGGAYQTWSTQGSSYTYNLSGTSNNTVYYLYVTNKNAQITELALTYEGQAVNPTVTFAVNTAGYGTVSSSSLSVPSGSSIATNGNTVTINGTTVTATPAAATAQYTYSFSSWSNTSGTVTADRTITANFARVTNSFSITKNYNNCSGNAPTSVQYGSSFTDTITPYTGYHVPSTVSVTVGSETRSVTPSGNILTVSNVTGNVSYTVTCEINSYSITGNIFNGTLSNDGESINHGTAYSGTINPTGTALFPDDIVVTIGGSSTTNFDYDPSTGEVNIVNQYVTGDIVITATCYYPYSISPSCVGGSVDYAQSDSNIGSDGTATVIFVANQGYALPDESGIAITGAELIEYEEGTAKIGNATNNVTITCTCIEITDKDIHVNVTNATASGDTTITIGGEAKVNLVADDGYRLPYEDEFTVTGADADFEFNQEHTTVEISLSSCVNDVVISGSSVHRWNISTEITNGSCSPTSGVVDNGDDWSTTLSPNTHYKLPQKSDITVTMGGSSIDDFTYNNGTISLTNITGDVSISASMIALATYTVTFDLSQHISGPSSATIEEGGIEEYEFTVSDGYYLPDEDEIRVEPNNGVDWSWVEESDTTGVLTISNPISDVTIQIKEKSDDLDHITLSPASGTYTLGDTLTMPTVTAYFTISDPRVLTEDEFTFSGVCIDSKTKMLITSGKNQTITFSCTINNITKEATYSATVNVITPTTEKFVKVTSGTVASGKYLIVNETAKVAFNGGINSTTYDTTSNIVQVTISNSEIAYSAAMDAASFTFDASAGTLKSAAGYYIGRTANSTGINASKTEAYTNTITVSSGTATIKASNDYVLRYNANSGQDRFRYYSGESVEAIQIYKYQEATVKELKWITAAVKAGTYYQGSSVTASDFVVTGHYNDGSTSTLSTGVTVTNGYLANIGNNEVTLTYSGISCKVNVIAVKQTAEYTGLLWAQGEYTIIDGQNIDFSKFGTVTAEYNHGEVYATKAISSCTVATYTKSGDVYTKVADLDDGDTITSTWHGEYLGVTYTETNTYTAYSSAPIYVVEAINDVYKQVATYSWSKVTSLSAGDIVTFVSEAHTKVASEMGDKIISAASYEGSVSTDFYFTVGTVTVENKTYYTFQNENGYLGNHSTGTSGSNYAHLDEQIDTETNKNYFTVSFDKVDKEGNVVITSVFDSNRVLQIRSGNTNDRFCFYGSSQDVIQLYKGTAGYSPTGESFANTNATVQKAVLQFAEHFNDTMDCVNSGTTSDVSSKWSTLSSNFSTAMSGFAGDDLAHFKALFANAYSVVGGDTLQDMLARYNYIVSKYKLSDDFLHHYAGRGAVAYSARVTPFNIIGNNGNTVAIIVVISMISVTAIGGYFFLRRRKEN